MQNYTKIKAQIRRYKVKETNILILFYQVHSCVSIKRRRSIIFIKNKYNFNYLINYLEINRLIKNSIKIYIITC